MSAADLRHALGALCTDGPDGLWVTPASDRQVADVVNVLKAQGASLHRDVRLSRAALVQMGALEPQSGVLEAQAGVPLQSLEVFLNERGHSLGALSPGALRLCLGEFLEGPYAGLRAVAGGRLEPLSMAVSAVMADGRLVHTHASPRSATGPDLNALFLGAGARLGVVTSARVRAVPRADHQQVLRASLPSAQALVDWLVACLGEGCLIARARLVLSSGRVQAELSLSGLAATVARDEAHLQRRLEPLGGRPSGVSPEPLEGPEREAGWPAVARALMAGQRLELFRLSQGSVLAVGELDGRPVDQLQAWDQGSSLCAAFDAARALGGSP